MKRRTKRVVMLPPETIALSYSMALEKVIDRAFGRLRPKERQDASVDTFFSSAVVRSIARTFFQRVADFNAHDLARALGVDLFTDDEPLKKMLAAFAIENATLIKSTIADLQDNVARLTSLATQQGTPSKILAAQLQERLNISKRHARIIARDQLGKAYTDISKHRQEEIGIVEYVWRTAQDPRVRDDHQRREGKVFKWADAPKGGHPGKAILCRCYAEPVLETATHIEEEE